MYIGVDPNEINGTNINYGPVTRATSARAQWPMRAGIVDAVEPLAQRDPAVLNDILVGVLGRRHVVTQGQGQYRNDSSRVAAARLAMDERAAYQAADGSLVVNNVVAQRISRAMRSGAAASIPTQKMNGSLGSFRVDPAAIIDAPAGTVQRLSHLDAEGAVAARASRSAVPRNVARGYGWRR